MSAVHAPPPTPAPNRSRSGLRAGARMSSTVSDTRAWYRAAVMLGSRPMGEPPAEPRSHRAGAAVLIVPLLLALSALAWRGWSTRYVSDDYCTAAGLHEDGYI